MELSVIIPVFREEGRILQTLDHLLSLEFSLTCEVIIVDGHPAGSTLAFLRQTSWYRRNRKKVRLIRSPKGRGLQMNAGANAAKGDLLFFLHADTQVAQRGIHQMTTAWKARTSPWFCGAFDLAIAAPGPWFRIIEKTASLRSRVTRIPYGDQGIFMSRSLFDALGGFPAVPLMEDVGLMACVKRKGIRPLFLDTPVRTSARRWEEKGVLRTTLGNWTLITLYCFGVSPVRLARFY